MEQTYTAQDLSAKMSDAHLPKYRIVFNTGRDLNIFDVVDINLDGQWSRYTDSKGRTYLVDPAKVNYIEVK